jgi:Holliday junction resolvase RusA-like endonuclease
VKPLTRVVVHALPAPQGSKDPFRNPHTGRIHMVETNKKVLVPWRDAVRAAAWERIRCCPDPECEKLADGYPLDEALLARMVFTLPKPVSAPKTRRIWPKGRPDLSKLARSTEDALSDIGLWRNDARVVGYTRLAKVFPGEDPEALGAPGVVIEVYPVAGAPLIAPAPAAEAALW